MKDFFRQVFFEHWSLKATAILLALILWLFVRGEPGITEKAAPLEIRVPRYMEITNERPNSIYVTMRTIHGAPQPSLTCIINLQQASEGRHVITLTQDNLKLSNESGVEALQFNPARVTLVLEKTISKEAPIVAPVVGTLLPGFELYDRIVTPTTVILTGPRSIIESINEVPTETISIKEKKQSFKYTASLNPKDDSVRTSLTDPVQVEIQIGPQRKLHTITDVPVLFDNPSYSSTPKHVSVQVATPPGKESALTPELFTILIPTKSFIDAQLPVKIKPQAKMADGNCKDITIKSIFPPEIAVQKKKTAK
jgi:YbbR domain-containing protein